MDSARLSLLALTLGCLVGCQTHRHDAGPETQVLVIELKSGMG